MENKDYGIVIQAVGPIIDVRFYDYQLPSLLTALRIPLNENEDLIVEIQQYVGDDTARCVAMGPTDGIVRGMKAYDTHAPISVPVGNVTLGRVFNVLGNPLLTDYAPITLPTYSGVWFAVIGITRVLQYRPNPQILCFSIPFPNRRLPYYV